MCNLFVHDRPHAAQIGQTVFSLSSDDEFAVNGTTNKEKIRKHD
jgi:hypothetical protein